MKMIIKVIKYFFYKHYSTNTKKITYKPYTEDLYPDTGKMILFNNSKHYKKKI